MTQASQTLPATTLAVPTDYLSKKAGAIVFLAFAAAYFCSALVRAITATLSPVLTQEFSLHARDLGLLAGGYFLGFAATQLPLGAWLDRYGPKRVILCFLTLALVGCAAFSMAGSFAWLLASRVLLGMGVSACLMAPLTGYRRWFDAATLLRANSWMLMTASLGMLASTLPVQWLMPLTGWRPLFWILAVMIMLAMAAIAWLVPTWKVTAPAADAVPVATGYADVWRNPYFRRMSPLAFFNQGGLVAVQTLWAGPWMVKVAGYTPLESATGLFCINATMLVTFWTWGMVNPWLVSRGWSANRLITRGVPLSLMVLAFNILGGSSTGWVGWALFCVSCSTMGLAQPAVSMAFPASLAGRAMSAYNLVIFAGVFVMQWSIGLLIDVFSAAGLTEVASFQAAMGVFLCCCIASYTYFLCTRADNSRQ
ncbi:MFS transporter [Polaromonas sp. SM01]|uniref:MFS transporter n=1 Tax=Polaromonas sp. SM01 TaxID=3085630 RepID=UPI0029827DC8|nr:MFS transporter [Polaromonas sp. SM01]MDW5445178.1 MFS transporter [Polaromonas sp. SM01]